MSTKNKVVVFSDDGALIITNPEDLDYWAERPNVLINPDVRGMKGIPPEYWKLNAEGQIIEMTEDEKKARPGMRKPADETSAIKSMYEKMLDESNVAVTSARNECERQKTALKAIQQSLEQAYLALAMSRTHARVSLILGISGGLIVGFCAAALRFR